MRSSLQQCVPIHQYAMLFGCVAEHNTLSQWEPTREGYLKFLVESKQVYEVLEQIVQQAHVSECELHCPE